MFSPLCSCLESARSLGGLCFDWETQKHAAVIEHRAMRNILVLGGSGRIGRAVAALLLETDKDCCLTLVGRNAVRGEKLLRALGDRARFVSADVYNENELAAPLKDADLVIHTAGPFQETEPTLLRTAITCGVPYLDIADDLSFAQKARDLSALAKERGVPALVNGGIFPGMSNVMAGLLAERGSVTHLAFSYFIAGSGGAGPGVMASTFMLGTTPVTEYVDGKAVPRVAFTGEMKQAFLPPIGKRSVYFLELPEVTSCFETYKIPNVVARFGTSPGIWNHLTRWCCSLFRPWLSNRKRVSSFVGLSLPFVRLLDLFVGKAIGMEVEAKYSTGETLRASYAHPNTIASIAQAVVAQANEILEKRIPPGVYWPEEAIQEKRRHLVVSSRGGLLHLPDEKAPNP